MTVLNFEYHPGIGMGEACTRIRDFAVTQGWTIVRYGVNEAWGSVGGGNYDYVAGGGAHLVLENKVSLDPAYPYPNQYLHFRLQFENVTSTNTAEKLRLGMPSPGNEAIDYTSSTNPWRQSNVRADSYSSVSLNPQGPMNLWLFGNNHQIIGNFEMSATINSTFWIGTVELYDTNEAEGNVCDPGGTYDVYSTWPWDQGNHSRHDGIFQEYIYSNYNAGHSILYNGVISSKATGNSGIYGASSAYDAFVQVRSIAIQSPLYSGQRVLMRHQCWMYESKPASPMYQQWFPFGTFPAYVVDVSGLPIGAELKYGSQRFLTFPRYKTYTGTSNQRVGYALRVE